MQKLMRVAIGTNNVDNCARICHAPSAAGLVASYGLAGGTNPFEDFDRAGAFLIAGSNPTEAHPVVGARIKQRVIAGARLVVVDPRKTELARYADVHLRPRPGTNVAVFNGLAGVLIAEGMVDERFVAERTEGFAELRELLADYGPERVEEISGVPATELRRAARLYGESDGRTLIWGLGVTEHAHGTDGVRTLANLATLTGSVGTADRRRRKPAAWPEQRPGRLRHGGDAGCPARATRRSPTRRSQAASKPPGACRSAAIADCGSRRCSMRRSPES